MKLAIAGAGITGAYLYRRLKNEGHQVHLFERGQKGGCGLTSCAWGTSEDFFALVARAGLAGEKYVLRRLGYLWMDGGRIEADLLTFDKPALVRDLLEGASLRPAPVPIAGYQRVIDATGVSRALLPPIADDIVLECRQYLVETAEPLENRIRLGGIGYAWCFPLAENRYHIGCGSLLDDPQQRLDALGWLARPGGKILCRCVGKIRLTGPHRSHPVVTAGCPEGVWGVGEAVGCVAPLAGDGIVPGMRSVELLLESWNDPQRYRKRLVREFHWMKKERQVVDALRRAQGVGLYEANVLRKNARRMGMRVRLRDALSLLRSLG